MYKIIIFGFRMMNFMIGNGSYRFCDVLVIRLYFWIVN